MGSRLKIALSTAALALALGLAGAPLPAWAKPLAPAALEQAIGSHLGDVQEFRFIREEAEKLGVRAYLFGGTAASFAHYVSWDERRRAGETAIQAGRFDYDYTNIYHSSQDLDIVIDGTGAQARELQEKLQEKFPHLQGSKTAWEVRLLKSEMSGKESLLGNPDFLNQHTDSNSTGMIELTKPETAGRIVRDLRDWESAKPHFLRDVAEGRIRYYFSPEHETTSRFRKGNNPPIISVIRYLTKVGQFDLEPSAADLARVRKIIDEFDPARVVPGSYVDSWIEKNGRKLLQNAADIERAWDRIEGLGLRKKLIRIHNQSGYENTLGWWLSKEPLRSEALGTKGRTAREIFAEHGLKRPEDWVVAHETRSYAAYESITKAATGEPNVFISRDATAGEGAAFGNGFYTKIGRQGAAGTGITVRFRLDPEAREGKDFIQASFDYIVVRNKRALQVIPETLSLDPVEYFKLLAEGYQIDASDRAIFEKLRRRVGNKLKTLTPAQKKEIRDLVARRLGKADQPADSLMTEWMNLGLGQEHPKLLWKYLARPGVNVEKFLAECPSCHAIIAAPANRARLRELFVKAVWMDPIPGKLIGELLKIDGHLHLALPAADVRENKRYFAELAKSLTPRSYDEIRAVENMIPLMSRWPKDLLEGMIPVFEDEPHASIYTRLQIAVHDNLESLPDADWRPVSKWLLAYDRRNPEAKEHTIKRLHELMGKKDPDFFIENRAAIPERYHGEALSGMGKGGTTRASLAYMRKVLESGSSSERADLVYGLRFAPKVPQDIEKRIVDELITDADESVRGAAAEYLKQKKIAFSPKIVDALLDGLFPSLKAQDGGNLGARIAFDEVRSFTPRQIDRMFDYLEKGASLLGTEGRDLHRMHRFGIEATYELLSDKLKQELPGHPEYLERFVKVAQKNPGLNHALIDLAELRCVTRECWKLYTDTVRTIPDDLQYQVLWKVVAKIPADKPDAGLVQEVGRLMTRPGKIKDMVQESAALEYLRLGGAEREPLEVAARRLGDIARVRHKPDAQIFDALALAKERLKACGSRYASLREPPPRR